MTLPCKPSRQAVVATVHCRLRKSLSRVSNDFDAIQLYCLNLERPARLDGLQGEVYDASFSADGRLVITASADNTARLWHAGSGLPVATLKGHSNTVVGAAFAPDERHVVTASWDGTARLWELPFGTGDNWIKYARDNVPRNLTDDERRLYVGERTVNPTNTVRDRLF